MGHLSFRIDAVRQLDRNTGTAQGTIRATSPATWTNHAQYERCRLTFTAPAPHLIVVAQEYAYGDCGFGYGVTADGTYLRVRR